MSVGSRRSPLARACAVTLVVSCVLIASGGTARLGAEERESYFGWLLSDALADLQSDGLKIIYSSDLVTPDMRVEASPAHESAPRLLAALLEPHGLAVKNGPGGTLLIVEAPAKSEALDGTIRGAVRNGRTLDSLPATEVYLLGTPTRVVTGSGGEFLIPHVQPGIYTLEVRRPGFVLQHVSRISVTAGETAGVTVDLSPAPTAVERISVSPTGDDLRRHEPEPRTIVTREDVTGTPGLGNDLTRTVSRLPGVTGTDTSAGLNIRGGTGEEVMVVLDGLEIYEPFHLTRMFTIFDSDAIGGAEILTGAFPVEYGDSMSGVIDTFSMTPSGPLTTSIGISTTQARVESQGSFSSDRGRWLVTARQGYPELSVDTFASDSTLAPTFNDMLAKFQYRISERSTASVNVLAAYDSLEHQLELDDVVEGSDSRSSIAYGWLNFKTVWSPRLLSQTVVSVGHTVQNRGGSRGTEESNIIDVTDDRSTSSIGLKSDWSWNVSDRHLLKAGLDVKTLNASYDYSRNADEPYAGPGDSPDASLDRLTTSIDPTGNEYGLYLADRIRVTEPLTVEIGLRWDRQTYTGIVGDDQISPRVNISYALPRTVVRAGWGRFYQSQGINELQVADGIDRFYPAQLSEHLVLGFERRLGGGLDLGVELYQKTMSGLRPRYENLFDPYGLFPEVGNDRVLVAPSSSEAKGLEISLGRNGRRWSWWGSYTLASVDDVIDGQAVPRSWDQRHALGFGVRYRRGLWDVNLAGELRSGWPTTGVTAETIVNPDGSTSIVAAVGPRNAERLPYYERVDMRVSRLLPTSKGQLRFFVQVLNVFDYENPCCVKGFDFDPRPDGSLAVAQRYDAWLPRLPSVGFSWEF